MAKNLSDRKNMSSNNRPFSLKATKKTQKVNLQTVKIDGKKVRLTTKEIRSLEKYTPVPIIALTAGTLKEERDLCLASGMNDFVSKPIVKDTLREVILKWFNLYKN